MTEISKDLSEARAKAESASALEEMVASLNRQKMDRADEVERAKKEARSGEGKLGMKKKNPRRRKRLKKFDVLPPRCNTEKLQDVSGKLRELEDERDGKDR